MSYRVSFNYCNGTMISWLDDKCYEKCLEVYKEEMEDEELKEFCEFKCLRNVILPKSKLN